MIGPLGRRRKKLLDYLKDNIGIGNQKKEHYMELCRELSLEEVMDLL
jgi:hypothetical protein